VATADLDAIDGGTRVRLCWTDQGGAPPDPAQQARIRAERASALDRLGRLVAASLPVLDGLEA
jgi:hypothetical protein